MAKKKLVIPPKEVVISAQSSDTVSSNSTIPLGYKEGPKRLYFSTKIDSSLISKTTITKKDKIIFLSLFFVTLINRVPDSGVPNLVVFDEIHTIKHINNYLNGVYFNDISPPLAHLFYTFFAHLRRYEGTADIAGAGASYAGTDFPFASLRFITILLSSVNTSLLFLTLRTCGVRSFIAIATSSLLLFENMVTLHSKLFMPDTLFLLGLSSVIYGYKRFDISQPFSKDWFRYVLATGVGLGLTISTKWIGWATLFWVLSLSAIKLWYLLSDIEVTDCQLAKHTVTRVVSFIVIPILVYLLTFRTHISILQSFHSDASFLTPDFQRTLTGNDIADVPKYPTFGSTVTIRHVESIGGYLHSHPYNYKSGSHNQQVTVFDYKDYGNEWIIEATKEYNKADPRIRQNTEFRLRHSSTGKLLRVDNFKPPISEQEYDFEVSCFGNETFAGESEDTYWIRFDPDDGETYLTAFDTQFQIQNIKKKCWILSHDMRLPDWGFNQQEVICINSPVKSRSMFYIETVKYPEDFDIEEGSFFEERVPKKKPSFFKKFFELNSNMIRINKEIKPKNSYTADPVSWLFDARGVRYISRKGISIYSIGNPVVFWLVIILIPAYATIKVVDFLRVDPLQESHHYKSQAFIVVTGYLFHLLPYIMNEGEWYIHYYLPSLYFGIILIGITYEFMFWKNKRLGYAVITSTVLMVYYFYVTLSPLTFGTEWTEAACEAAKVFPTWDFSCNSYS